MFVHFLKDYVVSGELLHHAGDDRHVERSVAEKLFFDRIAEPVRYTSYVDRLNHETPQATTPAVVGWALREEARPPLIVKTFRSETYYFETPPADCPPEIVRRHAALVEYEKSGGSDVAVAKFEQAQYDARMKTAKRY